MQVHSYEDELKHYGVLGMKWGVRRTSKQLERRSTTDKKRRDADKTVKKKRKETSAIRRHLSDGDLKKAIERLQSEKKLKDLTDENIAPGKTTAKRILTTIGKGAVTTAGTAVATYAIKAAMEGNFDIKDAAKFIRPKK